MNKSGQKDFRWCKITMVSVEHSLSCGMHQGNIYDGGVATGFIMRLYLNMGLFYHAEDTGVFLDM